MRANFVLVDFENVQPKDLGLLKEGPFQVKVFLGPNQSRIPVDLASALQSLGTSAEYVVLETAHCRPRRRPRSKSLSRTSFAEKDRSRGPEKPF